VYLYNAIYVVPHSQGAQPYPFNLIRAPFWLLHNYNAMKYAVSKLTMTKRCSLIFMKFQHCCRYGQLCCQNVERPFDFVASFYGAKVDRVEFNFVASVYT